jgi:hypothetical protein
LLIIGIWMYQAVFHGPAPSMRAASRISSGMLFRAPYITTIQPPAPVQNAISTRMTGRFPGARTWSKLSRPRARSSPAAGLTAGSSMNSHTSTLATPARAPGM